MSARSSRCTAGAGPVRGQQRRQQADLEQQVVPLERQEDPASAHVAEVQHVDSRKQRRGTTQNSASRPSPTPSQAPASQHAIGGQPRPAQQRRIGQQTRTLPAPPAGTPATAGSGSRPRSPMSMRTCTASDPQARMLTRANSRWNSRATAGPEGPGFPTASPQPCRRRPKLVGHRQPPEPASAWRLAPPPAAPVGPRWGSSRSRPASTSRQPRAGLAQPVRS